MSHDAGSSGISTQFHVTEKERDREETLIIVTIEKERYIERLVRFCILADFAVSLYITVVPKPFSGKPFADQGER